jgi:hypothetical protein
MSARGTLRPSPVMHKFVSYWEKTRRARRVATTVNVDPGAEFSRLLVNGLRCRPWVLRNGWPKKQLRRAPCPTAGDRGDRPMCSYAGSQHCALMSGLCSAPGLAIQ